ncbi:MAG: secretin N-terminal domain-containing protein [Pseudomonadota bacterium]
MKSSCSRLALLLCAAALLAGCAGQRLHREGLELVAEGKTEEGLAKLEQAVRMEPTNARFRADLRARREEQIAGWLALAASSRAAGHPDVAEATYRRILGLDPGNARAQEGLNALLRDKRHAAALQEARDALKLGDTQRALFLLRTIQAENPAHAEALELLRRQREQQHKKLFAQPVLKPGNDQPVTLRFTDASVKMIFEALGRAYGVNFILDKDVQPTLRTSIQVAQVTLEDAVDLLLQTNRLEKKVLSPSTMLIFPNTPEKLKEYQELVVKAFYLANSDAKQAQSMLKGLLKIKDSYIDERLNLLVVRDTPEAMHLVERLVAMQDLFEPEVMLEVEVLEVQRTRLTELGIHWPDQLVLSPLPSSGTTTTLADLRNLPSSRVAASITPLTINLRGEVGDANILANPRIRVRNREKARILIGNKVPVVTTTATSTGFVSESVQYLDVGLKLEVEPNVYLQDDVAIKIGLEVSSIVREIRTATGSLTYQIGTRNASTVLRLRDGETQILAGLISDEDRMAASRVPGLGDLPVVGRLFSSQKDDSQKTEIVLSITPRLVRNINRLDGPDVEFWSGTESLLRTRPLHLGSWGPQGVNQEAPAKVAPAQPGTDGSDAHRLTLGWEGPRQATVGEHIRIALRAKSDGPVRGIPFQAVVDPEAFEVVEVVEGAFLKQGDATTSFSVNSDRTTGRVFVGAARTGTSGAQGDAVLATLVLKAKAPKRDAQVGLVSATALGAGERAIAATLPPPLVIRVAE